MDSCEHGDEPKDATIETVSLLYKRRRNLFRRIN
jgi:hypothetical protein